VNKSSRGRFPRRNQNFHLVNGSNMEHIIEATRRIHAHSAALAKAAAKSTAENLVVIHDPVLAGKYTEE
jgi:hypothetical protein